MSHLRVVQESFAIQRRVWNLPLHAQHLPIDSVEERRKLKKARYL
jgi:hypothetical protein